MKDSLKCLEPWLGATVPPSTMAPPVQPTRSNRAKQWILAALIAAILYTHSQFAFVPIGDLADADRKEEFSATVDPFRYRGQRWHKNVTASNAFLYTELRNYHAARTNGDCDDSGPVIVGRFGASEQHLISYSELPADTTQKIPDDYTIPGYYFLPEESQTFADQRQLAQHWGRQRTEAYSVMNAFGLFDGDYRPDQARKAWNAMRPTPPGSMRVPWFRRACPFSIPTTTCRGRRVCAGKPCSSSIPLSIPFSSKSWQ
jgi:hypothetical protein